MCIAEGDVRERLIGAIQTISILSTQKFPEHLQSEFDWIMAVAIKHKSPYPNLHSDLEETMRKIRRATGRKIAERLFKLYSNLQDIRGFPLLEFRNPME